jgi:hypothetical protein
MTRHAIDQDRGELMAMWETGYGAAATRVAPLPDGLGRRERQALAAELSGLAEALAAGRDPRSGIRADDGVRPSKDLYALADAEALLTLPLRHKNPASVGLLTCWCWSALEHALRLLAATDTHASACGWWSS